MSGMINQSPLDRFSLLHMGFGYVCGKGQLDPLSTMSLAVSWEFAERRLKKVFPRFFPHPAQDSGENAIMDVVVTMAGWWLAKRYAKVPRVPAP